MERVLERLKPVVEEEIELVMESMERKMKQAMEPPMKRANERAKKKRAMESTFSTQDAPAERNVNQRTSLDHQIEKSENVELQLQFINNKLPDKIHTNELIKDDRNESVEIKLIDTNSRKTIEKGHFSSMKIQIHVLDSDFGSEGHEEFNAKILTKRQLGNGTEKLLVKGNQEFKLTDGVGTIQDLQFIENSSWRPSKKFRLGARVLQSSASNMGQVTIKEAITEPFRVLDHRGKMYKKHDRPSLDDKVWHLKKITRNRDFHIRLKDKGIRTIRDLRNTNLNKLREILKDCSDSDWKEILKHASSVADDEKLNASSNPVISPTTLPHQEPNLARQSPAKSTCSAVNAQGKHDFPFEKLESGDSGQNSSRPSELNLFPTNNTQPMIVSSQNNYGPYPQFPGVQHPNALEADSNHPEAEAYHNPTTGLAGIQYNKNHASSSHGHKGGFSTVPPLAAQPLATSTGSRVNAQGVQRSRNFQPPTNGVSGWNLSQCNDNLVMTQSSRFNHGPHSRIPAVHASNAFSNPELIQGNTGTCNSHNTVSSQNNNGPYPQFPGLKHTGTGLPCHPYTEPNQALAGMRNNFNLAQSSSATLQENHPNLTAQCLDDFLKADSNDSQQGNLSQFIELIFSQNTNGLPEQNMVTTSDDFMKCFPYQLES